jgi:hypothetical protein
MSEAARRTLVTVAGLACGGAVAALGALMLGEYELEVGLGTVAGAILGVAVAETVAAVGRTRGLVPAVPATLAVMGAMLWAGWIDSGQGIEPVKTGAWLGAALGGLVTWVRLAGFPGRTRR